ncbi:MAG TPA: biotin transporter BioY [Bacteroidia bacterium]|nr:biotin transporter BioY [Bacteroidia bacterium]
MKLNYKPEPGLLWQAPTVLVGLIISAKFKLEVSGNLAPFTLQTLVLCITCLYFSRQANLLGTFLYMVAGMYFPVFSSNEIFGREFYFGYNAGYIYGFPLAVILITSSKENYNSWFTAFSWLLMAHALILACGTAWGIFYKKVDYGFAVQTGFMNLLPGAIAKSIVVSLVYWLTQKNLKNEKVD